MKDYTHYLIPVNNYNGDTAGFNITNNVHKTVNKMTPIAYAELHSRYPPNS